MSSARKSRSAGGCGEERPRTRRHYTKKRSMFYSLATGLLHQFPVVAPTIGILRSRGDHAGQRREAGHGVVEIRGDGVHVAARGRGGPPPHHTRDRLRTRAPPERGAPPEA